MKRCLLIAITMALTGAACGTATAVGPGAGAPQGERWLEDADRPPEPPDVVVTATSPDQVQFQADAPGAVIPLKPARPATRSARRGMVLDGMWIGAGLGVLAGLISGGARDRMARENPDASCDPFACGGNTLLTGAMVGAIGLGLGAAVGSIIGRF